MSITSPIPVLQGAKGTELRSEGAELLLRRPDDELRIPLPAIARVRAERRDVTVELTAPEGVEPTAYRVEDVSAAAASVFADVVNAALPERAEGEKTVDGSTLVVTRSLRADDDQGEEGPEDVQRGLRSPDTWAIYTGTAAVAVLAVAVGVLDGNWARAIATLLLGELGLGAAYVTSAGASMAWREWYLPRHGITVDAKQVYRDGNTTLAYVDTDGVTHHVFATKQHGTVRVAYHPRRPNTAVPCTGWGELAGTLGMLLFVAAVTALLLYGTYRLALPAF